MRILFRQYWSVFSAAIGFPTIAYLNFMRKFDINYQLIEIGQIASFSAIVWASALLAFAISYVSAVIYEQIVGAVRVVILNLRSAKFRSRISLSDPRSDLRYESKLDKAKQDVLQYPLGENARQFIIALNFVFVFWFLLWGFGFYRFLILVFILAFAVTYTMFSRYVSLTYIQSDLQLDEADLISESRGREGRIVIDEMFRRYRQEIGYRPIRISRVLRRRGAVLLNTFRFDAASPNWIAAVALILAVFSLNFGSAYAESMQSRGLYLIETSDFQACGSVLILTSDRILFQELGQDGHSLVPNQRVLVLKRVDHCG